MFFIRLLYELDRKLGDHIVGDLLHGAVVSVPQRPEPQLDRPHGHQSLRVVPDTADIVIRYYLHHYYYLLSETVGYIYRTLISVLDLSLTVRSNSFFPP